MRRRQLRNLFIRPSEPTPAAALSFPDDETRLRSLARSLDEIYREAKAKVGAADLAHIRRVDRCSRGCEVVGRGLLWFGPGPVSFLGGVALLWIHKQLQTAEIGHTTLHGAFNRIEGADEFRSASFAWRGVPIDESSWIAAHNGRHHGLTNVVGEDPDMEFGRARLTDRTPHRAQHRSQLASVLVSFPIFTLAMAAHSTGITALYFAENASASKDTSSAVRREAWTRLLRKVGPHYLKELVVFPLLAGPRFLRVLAGNILSEVVRDVYTASTIYCGHVGPEVESFPAGTRPTSKGERYEMQIAASNDFRVPWVVSVLCGGLDRQVEHHLFPSLPTNRLRDIASDVRRVAEEHGVPYRDRTWGETLRAAFNHVRHLSHPDTVAVAASSEHA